MISRMQIALALISIFLVRLQQYKLAGLRWVFSLRLPQQCRLLLHLLPPSYRPLPRVLDTILTRIICLLSACIRILGFQVLQSNLEVRMRRLFITQRIMHTHRSYRTLVSHNPSLSILCTRLGPNLPPILRVPSRAMLSLHIRNKSPMPGQRP